MKQTTPPDIRTPEPTIDIAYEHPDASFVIAVKPAGLLSVPGRNADTDPAKADCVIARVRARYPHATGPMVVHRLDMETSGLIAVALTPNAQRELSAAFQKRLARKTYTAIARRTQPHPNDPPLNTGHTGDIHAPIRADISDRPRQTYDPRHGKPAHTRYRVLNTTTHPDNTTTARLELTPVTGRSHQLRVHCALPARIENRPAGLNAPIANDALYARGVSTANPDTSTNLAPRPEPPTAPLMLHASTLALPNAPTVHHPPPF